MKPKYTYNLYVSDFGTERYLQVFADGKPIGFPRDPFPQGIPVTATRRKRQCLKVAREIIKEWENIDAGLMASQTNKREKKNEQTE